MKICIFEQSNEKSNFSKTEIHFRKKTPQLLEHIGQQNMKVFIFCVGVQLRGMREFEIQSLKFRFFLRLNLS